MTYRTIKRAKTAHQGSQEIKMELTVARSSSVFLLTLALLLSESRFSNGLCNIRKNGTLARCNYLEDIKTIDTHQLKSLKVSAVGKHLSTGHFSNLTSLRHLDLSNGKLKKVEAGCFHQLQSLRSLDISNNLLTYLEPGALIDLPHLQVLNLSRNLLEQIPEDIANFKNLKVLDLSNNHLLCDCKALKIRDVLTRRGVSISKKTICSEPESVKGQLLIEPEIQRICMFDELDDGEGMQMDQPMTNNSENFGEGSGDSFNELEEEDIPDDENSTETSSISNTTIPIEVPLTSDNLTTSTDEEIFFTEETDKHLATSPVTKSTELTTEISIKALETSTLIDQIKTPRWSNEGSGDDDVDDPWLELGSGIEGSGAIIPHIIWDDLDQTNTKESNQDNSSISVSSTTASEGIIDTFFSLIWGSTASTPTPAPSSTTEDLSLIEEQFIPASTEGTSAKSSSSSDTEIIVPVVVSNVDKEKIIDNKKPLPDNTKNEQVKASPNEPSETADASAAQQSKKGMGSYVVLAILLSVLAVLIGFAAYKGDFCKERRKRNNRNIEASDVENGTELKDLRKSLLENSNSVQPKISSNGKPEEAPLVNSGQSTDSKTNETSSRFVGTINESAVDPIKPPRKSFSPYEAENGKKSGTNGKISQLSTSDNVQSLKSPTVSDVLVNGKNDRDSLSSVGESPSLGSHSIRLSNSRLSQGLPPASPGAQRVKITLQDNPDSIPKTPLLITRTKAGENLVKTP